MSERTDELRDWLVRLRECREAIIAQVAAARQAGGYQEQAVRSLLQSYATEARQMAMDAWRAVRRTEVEHREEARRTRRAIASDTAGQRQQAVAAEISARLADSGPDSDSGKPRLEVIAELLEEFRRREDPHALRSLRLLASPFLERVRSGAEWELAARLRAAFREDEAADVPPELRALTLEEGELRRLTAEIRAEILAAEAVAAGEGTAGAVAGGTSLWAVEILGEVPGATADPSSWSRAGPDAESRRGRSLTERVLRRPLIG